MIDEDLSDLDLKNDLCLKEELSLSDKDDVISINDQDFNIDFIEEGDKFKDIFEDEYGVDLKSVPETIIKFEDKKIDFDTEKILNDEEFSRKLEEDDNIVKVNLSGKESITIDDEQFDYLNKDLEDLNNISSDQEIEDFSDKEINDLSLESLEEKAMEEVLDDESIITNESDIIDKNLESLGTDVGTPDEEIIETSEFEEIVEEQAKDQLDKIDLHEKINLNEEELDKIGEEISLEDNIILEEPVEEILDETIKEDFDVDLETNDIESLKLEDELIQEKSINTTEDDMLSEEKEKIILDETELNEIEGEIFPEEEEMPELDEDIKKISLAGSGEELSNSISPLSDSGTVFSEEIYEEEKELETPPEIISQMNKNIEESSETLEDNGSLEDIDLESMPKPHIEIEETEDETIGFSGDELDNILNSTEIIETPPIEETIESDSIEILDEKEIPPAAKIEEDSSLEEESETIDLSNFETELKEVSTDELNIEEETIKESISISPVEEEEIYSSLKSEMQTKSEPEPVLLAEEVKTVLSYLDQLLDALPEEKIKEFAESETFSIYKKLFDELNIKH